MRDWMKRLSDDAHAQLRRARSHDWVPPMLATLTDEYFSSRDWLFERKLDGERCIVYSNSKVTKLFSRNQELINSQYPELVSAFERLALHDVIVDGEIVAFAGNRTSFELLQRRMHVRTPSESLIRSVKAIFYAFDLLYLDGYDVTQVPLRQRKSLLRDALAFEDPLRFTTHRNRHGERFLDEACGKGWEGVIAKRADARYTPGRSRAWLKFKCVNEQEFVIGGFTDPKGSRKGLGALLVGYYDDGQLVYAGKVGTGFGQRMLDLLYGKLSAIERDQSPFDRGKELPRRAVHWVDPELVGQVGFSEWTRDGQLRHPRFLGLRDDKDALTVVREEPVS